MDLSKTLEYYKLIHDALLAKIEGNNVQYVLGKSLRTVSYFITEPHFYYIKKNYSSARIRTGDHLCLSPEC